MMSSLCSPIVRRLLVQEYQVIVQPNVHRSDAISKTTAELGSIVTLVLCPNLCTQLGYDRGFKNLAAGQ